MTEVLQGRIDVGSIVLGSAAGRNDIRVLAVFDQQRHPDWPDAPTAVEQGFEVAPASFGGLFVLASTPEDRIARLSDAFRRALEAESARNAASRITPAWLNRLEDIMQVPMPLLPGDQLVENYSQVLKSGSTRGSSAAVSTMLFNSLVMALAIALGKIANPSIKTEYLSRPIGKTLLVSVVCYPRTSEGFAAGLVPPFADWERVRRDAS